MRRSFSLLFVAVIIAMIFPVWASAQAPVSLQEQLSAQYKLATMGSDSNGYSIVEEGTLLCIQKGNLVGVPYSEINTLPANRYEGGTVHPSSSTIKTATNLVRSHFGQPAQTTELFQKGDKVYATKIDVNPGKDTVTMGIVACDTCNKTDPPTYNKAQVVFVFPKGWLARASADQVEEIIGQLLAISNGDQGQSQAGQPDPGGRPQAGQDQQQQPETQTVKLLGMTTDQVVATMGKPDKIFDLGAKKLYIYKDMKVTLLDGKVSDVQ